jgi:ligand-binding SRPBCC domain-containing protein
VRIFQFTSEQVVPQAVEPAFAFFANAHNLELLTPPWLHFEILTPGPIAMHKGTRIDYRLKLHGLPLYWQSEITLWDPPRCFVDEQRRGPYRRWVHAHEFAAQGESTVVCDRVQYAVFGGGLVQWLFVEPDLKRIFAYRGDKLREAFAADFQNRNAATFSGLRKEPERILTGATQVDHH